MPPAPEPLDGTLAAAARVAPGRSVTTSLTLPWRANLIGVSFASRDPEASGITVTARAHHPGGWGAERAFRIEFDEAADRWEARRASPRVFTDAQWVGLADAVELTIESARGARPVREVRLHVINTAGDARPAGLLVRLARAVRRIVLARPVAAARPAKPEIITRAGWGADESIRGQGPGLADELRMAFVHHTTNSNSYSRKESAALVRGIYRYHVLGRGYSDIAYNFLVDRYGQVFEGRWGGITKPVIGAHTLGFNTGTTGIALIGTFTDASPPAAMLDALERVLAWKLDVHHLPPAGTVEMTSGGNGKYERGTEVDLARISGHRDGSPTACPGSRMYGLLPEVRDAVARIGRPKVYLPSQSALTVRPDGDGAAETTTFGASFSGDVSWRLEIADRSGAIARGYKGTGTEVAITWDGDAWDGTLLDTGRYSWRLEASGEGGDARPARGKVFVVGTHPSGTVLEDASGRYVVSGPAARAVDPIAYASRYGALEPAATGPAERSWYPAAGTALGVRPGSLFAGPDGARYIWSGRTLRRFATVAGDTGAEPADTFTALGYREDALIAVDQAWIDAQPPGAPVEDVTVHPAGSIVRDEATGEMFVAGSATRRPISRLAQRSRYRIEEVVTATGGDLALPAGTPHTVRPGTLVADPDDEEPWIVTGGVRRRFLSWYLFQKMGFRSTMLVPATAEELAAIPEGARLG